MKTEPALAASGVGFCYPERPLLRDIDLKLEAGHVVALLGPNGSGKSTLLKVLLGLLRPCRGEVRVAGRPLTSMRRGEIARAMAYVPQQTSVVFAYTAMEVVLMARTARHGLFSRTNSEDERVARAALERMRVGALADRIFSTLSGGERQLVLIARALAQEAPVLILDEPVAGLDFGNQIRFLQLIRQLADETNKAVLMTTHSPDHARACAGEVVVLKEGRIFDTGDPADVLNDKALAQLYGLDAAELDVLWVLSKK
jgi:iron complex transport system ATP-binding protein